ncbi:NifU family protein [bacterium]|jgi:Fe-S cluster biogenesis protein NfuA|nr:NifU family protein [bacterium]
MGVSQLTALVEQELAEIAPWVESHSGRILLHSIDPERGIVVLDLLGACSECPLSFYTVTMGIETRLKQKTDRITKVIIKEV